MHRLLWIMLKILPFAPRGTMHGRAESKGRTRVSSILHEVLKGIFLSTRPREGVSEQEQNGMGKKARHQILTLSSFHHHQP